MTKASRDLVAGNKEMKAWGGGRGGRASRAQPIQDVACSLATWVSTSGSGPRRSPSSSGPLSLSGFCLEAAPGGVGRGVARPLIRNRLRGVGWLFAARTSRGQPGYSSGSATRGWPVGDRDGKDS